MVLKIEVFDKESGIKNISPVFQNSSLEIKKKT